MASRKMFPRLGAEAVENVSRIGKVKVMLMPDAMQLRDIGEEGYATTYTALVEFVDNRVENGNFVFELGLAAYNLAMLGNDWYGILDSESEELGEIAYQLFENKEVKRRKYRKGVLVHINSIEVLGCTTPTTDDIAAITTCFCTDNCGVLQTAVESILAMFRDIIYPTSNKNGLKTPVQLVYFGRVLGEEMEEEDYPDATDNVDLKSLELDSALIPIFRQNDFAVFHCQEPECVDNNCFLAVYDGSAIDSTKGRKAQVDIPWDSPLVTEE